MNNDLPIPRVLRIEPAGACNLRCQHCPTGLIKLKRGIMSDQVIKRITEEALKHSNIIDTIVLYHGGEPFLNKNFFTILSGLKKVVSARIKTVSNGMLLDEPLVTKIVQSGLDEIEISLDGETEIRNDMVRKNSSGRKVISSIRQIWEKARVYGRTNFKITVSHVYFGKKKAGGELDLTEPKKAPKWILEGLGPAANDILFKPHPAMEWPDFKINDELFEVVSVRRHDGFLRECDNIESTITVRWDGQVVACCFDLTSQLVMGNILNQNLEEIWQSIEYGTIREQISQGKPNKTCAQCNQISPKQKYLVLKNGN